MDTEQIIEGQPQVPENPHAEYGLTENVERWDRNLHEAYVYNFKRIVENEKTGAEKTSKQKVDLQPINPIEFLAAYLLKNKAQFEDRN
ncbi:putative Protein dpy-30-like protein [Naja naja]|nr:putative Protein dpy-30-like protein [Naja naja]